MASRFYLPASGTAAITPTVLTGWENTAGWTAFPTDVTKSNTALASGASRQKGGTTAWADRLDRVYVSTKQLAAQTISAGTISAVIRGLEGSTATDAFLQIMVRVVSADGTTDRGTIFAGSTQTAVSGTTSAENGEWGTSLSTRIKNALTTSSVSAQAGDRIQIEMGHRIGGTTTTMTVQLAYGDATGTADYALTAALNTSLCPWVELSQNLTWAAPSGSGTGSWSFAGSGSGDAPAITTATLVDNFATKDTTKWTWTNADVVSGKAVLSALTGSAATVTATGTYNFHDSSIYAEISDVVGGARLLIDSSNYVNATPGGNLLLVANAVPVVTTPYDPVAHRWLRLREASNTVYLDARPDGQTAWSNVGSGSRDFNPLTAVSPSIFVPPGTGNTATFDNINNNPPSGSGTGSWSFTGTSTGTRPAGGSGSGTWTFTGAGTGTRAPQGTGTGSLAYSGAGTGTTARAGNGSSSWSFVGTGTGSRVSSGTGSGVAVWTGTGAGVSARSGTGAGATTWTGAGTGTAPTVGVNDGSGTGTVAWTGSGTGTRTPKATGSGVWTFTGAGTGVAPEVGGASGSGTGSWTYVGTGTGTAPTVGQAAGSGTGLTTWVGTGSGTRTARGAGTGTWAWAGTGTGTQPGEYRDITLHIGDGRSRTFTATATSRGLTATGGRSRTLTATGASRTLHAAGSSRTLTADPRE